MDATIIGAIITPVLAFAGGIVTLVINESRQNRKVLEELTNAIWTYIDSQSPNARTDWIKQHRR